ncbi:MAG: noncanonical pyrimidine nucleotidase, YjjG family [Chitinophagaceae bacterium]|nr:MAG: noncanonical pyrimidine nucleotidase, YjjG family [Chitinophagaceae bacterium]
MKYQHLFFDLDHTIWDFDANARLTLGELYETQNLASRGVDDFDLFHKNYIVHNNRLWEKYRNGQIKVDELRWKRMALTLLDFKIGDELLARSLGDYFLDMLPSRNLLFPYAIDMLEYLTNKGYDLHLITNGFEKTQHSKLKNSGIDKYFKEVITSEASLSIKPKKEIFEYAFKLTNSAPDKSIMIGDSIEADIQGAINAGIDQVHVNHINEVIDIQPTYTIYSLKELQEIF